MEDDLRKYGEQLRREGEERERVKQETQAEERRDLQERHRRAQQMAQKFLNHAQALQDESRTAVYLLLEHGEAGFTLRIGRPIYGAERIIAVQLRKGDKWVATTKSPSSTQLSTTTYDDDVSIEAARDGITRPLFKEAMRALIVDQTEQPGER